MRFWRDSKDSKGDSAMRRFLTFVGASLLWIGGCMSAQEAKLSSVNINGVDVPLIFEHSKILPVGEAQFVFVGGAADGEKSGLGILSAKMLNEGTKTLGNVGFAQKLESKAIGLSAGAGLQTLSLNLSFLSEYQDIAFESLKELLSDPNLTPNTLQKIKAQTSSKIARKQDDFDNVAQENLNRILFKDTPMQEPLIGDKESVSAISLQEVENYLKRNLVLERLIIVAGGDMEEEVFKQKVGKILAHLPKGESKKRLSFKAYDKVDSVTISKPTKQAFVYFGSPFDVQDQTQNYIAKVMSFILGSSGFGSRMMEEVRVKKGLAYSASMRVNVGGAVDYTSGHLQTQLENKDEAIKVVKEVVAEFVKNGATQEELDGAKAFLLGSEPLRGETLSQRLGAKFSYYFRGLPLDYNKRELESIKALDLKTLNAYITSHQEILQMSFSVVDAQASDQ